MSLGASEWAAAGRNHSPKGSRLEIPCPCLAACQEDSWMHLPEHWVAAPVSFHSLKHHHRPCLLFLTHRFPASEDNLVLRVPHPGSEAQSSFYSFFFFTPSQPGIMFHCFWRLSPSLFLATSSASLIHVMATTKWECSGPLPSFMLSIINTASGALFKYCVWKYVGLRMKQNLALEDLHPSEEYR